MDIFADDIDFGTDQLGAGDGFGLADAVAFGTGYGLYRHGQDRQTAAIVNAIQNQEVTVTVQQEEEFHPEPVNALDYTKSLPPEWDDYIGQDPLKKQIMVYIRAAQAEGVALPHTLLASGYPGVGKTTMARLIAGALGVPIIELVPPFDIYTLVKAAQQLPDKGILFIDEIHKLTDGVGARGAEVLLKVLEEKVAFMPDGTVIEFNDITIIGATTDRDKLPTPVIDRFKIKPYFQAYQPVELGEIAVVFADKHNALNVVDNDLCDVMAFACRNTPRIVEEMVMAAKALALGNGKTPTGPELLDFLEVEADGLTRTHIHYLTALRQYFGRFDRDGNEEFIVGEAAMQQILRETKPGIGRLEGFLVERGLIDRTPRGRRLTARGIERAEEFIAAGKGAADVA